MISIDPLIRRKIRLTEYDYSQPNAYFITICTKNRKKLFWSDLDRNICSNQDIVLSAYGSIVEQVIHDIPHYYPAIHIDHYVIMPDHIHILLSIRTDSSGRPQVATTISTVIQQIKGIVSKRAGFSLWQKGFYDHIIRGEKDYLDIWEYIDNNPVKWAENRRLGDQWSPLH